VVVAAHQELTRQWWDERSGEFELVVSELVELEAGLVSNGPIPREFGADALHIAIAAVNGIDYLLTWNHKHLANAVHRHRIEMLVEEAGYACPLICTPEELMEG
jgi:hypothetical protein